MHPARVCHASEPPAGFAGVSAFLSSSTQESTQVLDFPAMLRNPRPRVHAHHPEVGGSNPSPATNVLNNRSPRNRKVPGAWCFWRRGRSECTGQEEVSIRTTGEASCSIPFRTPGRRRSRARYYAGGPPIGMTSRSSTGPSPFSMCGHRFAISSASS